jgi:hypothetical protein
MKYFFGIVFFLGGEVEMMKPTKMENLAMLGTAAAGTGQLLSGFSSIAKLFGVDTRNKDEKRLAKLQNSLLEQQYNTEEERKTRQRNIRNYMLRGNF